MSQEKIKQLKLFIQGAAAQAAQDFYRLDQTKGDEPFGRCGACPTCQQSLDNLATLFKKSMERELARLSEKDFGTMLAKQMEKEGLSQSEVEERLRKAASETWEQIVPHLHRSPPREGLN